MREHSELVAIFYIAVTGYMVIYAVLYNKYAAYLQPVRKERVKLLRKEKFITDLLSAAHHQPADPSTAANLDSQIQEREDVYCETITQLESHYQSAVRYVKGTEVMLKRMKDELFKYKSENARLKHENFQFQELPPASLHSSIPQPINA
ncbi:hypothetical protein TruAng_003505 [Truncatella angustata]|nr:hypothetical protein TruAng_003505 [Truncatella angustata]